MWLTDFHPRPRLTTKVTTLANPGCPVVDTTNYRAQNLAAIGLNAWLLSPPTIS